MILTFNIESRIIFMQMRKYSKNTVLQLKDHSFLAGRDFVLTR